MECKWNACVSIGSGSEHELVQLEKFHGSNYAIKESLGLEAEGFSWVLEILELFVGPVESTEEPRRSRRRAAAFA